MARETASLTGEFIGEAHRVLECTKTQPPGNQHQKGPICLWIVEEVTESQPRAQQVSLFPLWTLPTYSSTTQQCGLPHLGEYLRLHPLQRNRYAKTKKNMAQMKEQIKATKIELSSEEIANLSDAEFKTMVIRMLTEMVAKWRKKWRLCKVK